MSPTGGTSAANSGEGRGAGRGSGEQYDVASVVDGDTIKVRIGGKKVAVRIIGLDTPEVHKPNTAVQCFGKEASSNMQSLVQSKTVQLEADPTQDEHDRYGRLLRHVFVGGDVNVGLAQIAGGFGREYTYDKPYRYQAKYRAAQAEAQNAKRGTWGSPCNGFHKDDAASAAPSQSASSGATVPAPVTQPSTRPAASASPPSGGCDIKGNINSKGDKIAHLPGSATYERTKVNKPGERMFCSVAEAQAAGFRIAAD